MSTVLFDLAWLQCQWINKTPVGLVFAIFSQIIQSWTNGPSYLMQLMQHTIINSLLFPTPRKYHYLHVYMYVYHQYSVKYYVNGLTFPAKFVLCLLSITATTGSYSTKLQYFIRVYVLLQGFHIHGILKFNAAIRVSCLLLQMPPTWIHAVFPNGFNFTGKMYLLYHIPGMINFRFYAALKYKLVYNIPISWPEE